MRPNVAFGQADSLATGTDSLPSVQQIAQMAAVDAPLYTLDQIYTGDIKGNVSRVSMGNRFNNSLSFRNGTKNITLIRINESRYRLQDRRDITKSLSSSFVVPVRPGLLVDAMLSDNRFFNRTITFSGASQDFFNNNQMGRATMTYIKPLPAGMTFDAGSVASMSRSEQTFLADRVIEGSARGALTYRFWGGRGTIDGRGYLQKTGREATTSGIDVKGLGADADSLVSGLRLALSDSISFQARYTKYHLTEESLELPRGVFVEQVFTEDLQRETKTVDNEIINIQADIMPLPRFRMQVSANHRLSRNYFEVQQNRINNRTVDRLRGNLTYSIGKAQWTIGMESTQSLNDLGPTSLGSNREKRKNLRFDWRQDFTRTLNATLSLGSSILQSFYLQFNENPRDRDQRDSYVNVRISSSPFPKIVAQVTSAVSRTDYVNIHNSFSQNNRQEISFDFRPEFTYTINPRISVRQTYGLNIEFTDFVFQEEENFLDRNVTFSNTITTQLFPSLSVEVFYGLVLHDRGSYLRDTPDSERLLDVEQEDRRDQMDITFRYRLNPHLTVVGKSDYSQRKDQFVGSPTSNIFKDGGIEVGVEGSYPFGVGRELKLNMKKVNRFGQFNTPEQEDYWEMDSSMNFAF